MGLAYLVVAGAGVKDDRRGMGGKRSDCLRMIETAPYMK
jgi:hypothetical protein